jgi:hypothetical protein
MLVRSRSYLVEAARCLEKGLDLKERQPEEVLTVQYGFRVAPLKENVATQLHDEIIAGRIGPEEKITEGRWARRFEALNILTSEGFVPRYTAAAVA